MHRGPRRVALALAGVGLACTSLLPTVAEAESDGFWDYRTMVVKGMYVPAVGDFVGDEADDILWQARSGGSATLWEGVRGQRGQAAFRQQRDVAPAGGAATGEMLPIVGDFGGDEHDDIFWYGPTLLADYLWISEGDGSFTSVRKFVSGSFTPLRLRNERPGGKDDLYLLATSSAAPSYLWRTADDPAGTIIQTKLTTAAGRRPVVGDWNADGFADLFLHGPGSLTDIQHLMGPSGLGATKTFAVAGSYQPVAIDEEGRDGILFWGPGTAKEAYWRGVPGGFRNIPVPWLDLGGTVTTWPHGAAIISGDGVPDAMFVAGATSCDFFYLAGPGHETSRQTPLVGDFDADGGFDVAWYGYGAHSDALWYLEVPTASAATEVTTSSSGAFRRGVGSAAS